MNRLLIISLFTIILASCAGENVSQERQDSLDAAAAADSMLREATKDTTSADNVEVDTSATNGL